MRLRVVSSDRPRKCTQVQTLPCVARRRRWCWDNGYAAAGVGGKGSPNAAVKKSCANQGGSDVISPDILHFLSSLRSLRTVPTFVSACSIATSECHWWVVAQSAKLRLHRKTVCQIAATLRRAASCDRPRTMHHGDRVRADGFSKLACRICKPPGQRPSASDRHARFSACHCLFRSSQNHMHLTLTTKHRQAVGNASCASTTL